MEDSAPRPGLFAPSALIGAYDTAGDPSARLVPDEPYQTTTHAERKTLPRMVVREVTVSPIEVPARPQSRPGSH